MDFADAMAQSTKNTGATSSPSPASATAAPAPPPPPPAPPASVFEISNDTPATSSDTNKGGIGAVFAELNQGENITKGLKK